MIKKLCSKNVLIGFLLITTFTITATAAPIQTKFYVSPSGRDSHLGTAEQPFRTLSRARAAVRNVKAKTTQPITVYLREGVYYLSEAIAFSPEDSGSKNAPITYQAYPNEQVVISGGVRLNLDWKPFPNGIMQAQVPREISSIDQLFVNGKRQHLARYPNYDPEAQFFGGTSADAIAPGESKPGKIR